MSNPFGPENDSPEPPPARSRFQFGMWVWFPAVFLVSVVAMGVGGLLRAQDAGDPVAGLAYVLLLSATPVGLILLMGLFRALARVARTTRRRR